MTKSTIRTRRKALPKMCRHRWSHHIPHTSPSRSESTQHDMLAITIAETTATWNGGMEAHRVFVLKFVVPSKIKPHGPHLYRLIPWKSFTFPVFVRNQSSVRRSSHNRLCPGPKRKWNLSFSIRSASVWSAERRVIRYLWLDSMLALCPKNGGPAVVVNLDDCLRSPGADCDCGFWKCWWWFTAFWCWGRVLCNILERPVTETAGSSKTHGWWHFRFRFGKRFWV